MKLFGGDSLRPDLISDCENDLLIDRERLIPLVMYTIPEALRRKHSTISVLNAKSHTSRFNNATWAKVTEPEVLELISSYAGEQENGYISRGDLFTLGEAARSPRATSSDRRRLFFATLMWGYGDVGGRGPMNACRALGSARLDDVLLNASHAVSNRDLAAAWDAFWKQVNGYDWAYFTKYLYFAGRTDDAWDVHPMILDSQVRWSLDFLGKWLGAQLEIKCHRRRDCYVEYCTLLQQWSDQLKVDFDQLEMYLFKRPDDFFFDPAPPLRELASVAITEARSNTVSKALAAAIDALPNALLDSLQ